MFRESGLCILPPGSLTRLPPCEATCHVTAHAPPVSSRPCTSEAELTDRLIRLSMNYSIIFTEISFFSGTSILLQIIRIIHMTIWIIPESDREGRAVCQIFTAQESPRAPSGPPFLQKGRSEGQTRLPKKANS